MDRLKDECTAASGFLGEDGIPLESLSAGSQTALQETVRQSESRPP